MLEQGIPPTDVWMEDVGKWVRWGPESILAQAGPPLEPMGEVLMEVEEAAMPAQEDGAMQNSTLAKQAA